jgi:hypothetical protein
MPGCSADENRFGGIAGRNPRDEVSGWAWIDTVPSVAKSVALRRRRRSPCHSVLVAQLNQKRSDQKTQRSTI